MTPPPMPMSPLKREFELSGLANKYVIGSSHDAGKCRLGPRICSRIPFQRCSSHVRDFRLSGVCRDDSRSSLGEKPPYNPWNDGEVVTPT
jgi:hypothetical protein